MSSKSAVYFPGLNALRFIGAFTVVFGHIELSKYEFGYSTIYKSLDFFKHTSGHLGVVLFYVLSGFLITYLLLAEKRTFQTINIFDFYVRRALRIWPIYYLIIAFVFFILPEIIPEYPGRLHISSSNFWEIFLIYFILVPNLSTIIGGAGGAFQLGTIGTEEQFYWVWPLLVSKSKHLIWVMTFIFIAISIIPHFVDYTLYHFKTNPYIQYFFEKLRMFLPVFQVNCMAIGGIMSYLYFEKKDKFLFLLYHPLIQIIAIVTGFGGWIMGYYFKYFSDETYALMFAIVILNVATNPNNLLKIENNITNYLGKISYGIYVYHWAILLMVLHFGRKIFNDVSKDIFWVNLYVYFTAIGITLIISHISYTYFESFFLKQKDKFAKIETSNSRK